MSGQIVEVSLYHARHSYAYVWDGDSPLNVGDRVAVPGPPSSLPIDRGTIIGTVVRFGSDYPGPLEAIIERVSA